MADEESIMQRLGFRRYARHTKPKNHVAAVLSAHRKILRLEEYAHFQPILIRTIIRNTKQVAAFPMLVLSSLPDFGY
jgi:hypothetical protein